MVSLAVRPVPNPNLLLIYFPKIRLIFLKEEKDSDVIIGHIQECSDISRVWLLVQFLIIISKSLTDSIYCPFYFNISTSERTL